MGSVAFLTVHETSSLLPEVVKVRVRGGLRRASQVSVLFSVGQNLGVGGTPVISREVQRSRS